MYRLGLDSVRIGALEKESRLKLPSFRMTCVLQSGSLDVTRSDSIGPWKTLQELTPAAPRIASSILGKRSFLPYNLRNLRIYAAVSYVYIILYNNPCTGSPGQIGACDFLVENVSCIN